MQVATTVVYGASAYSGTSSLFPQPSNCLSARRPSSRVEPTIWLSRTKNIRGWAWGDRNQGPIETDYYRHFKSLCSVFWLIHRRMNKRFSLWMSNEEECVEQKALPTVLTYAAALSRTCKHTLMHTIGGYPLRQVSPRTTAWFESPSAELIQQLWLRLHNLDSSKHKPQRFWFLIKWKLFNQQSRLIGTLSKTSESDWLATEGFFFFFYWELCDSGDFFCPLWLSAGSISDPLNLEGNELGCLKNEELNMALEEFTPLPSGCVSVCVHAYTCK